MGTLRFDLNTLATAKTGKEEKKAALALRKEFIRSVSTLLRLFWFRELRGRL
jgi:photosystem II oxygen-evolving enhancer protein 3